MENETLQDFLKELPDADKQGADIFKEAPVEATPEKEETAEQAEVRMNRRERRSNLQRQLDEEREARIRAEARAEALAETRQFAKETGVDERLFNIFSNDDVGKKGAAALAEMLAENQTKAKEAALEEFRQERVREVEEQKKQESVIDSQLEALEDKYNIDLTSNAPAAAKARREFLSMVEKFSPKDESGTITGFADFDSTYEAYQASKVKPDNTRRQDLGDRSLQSSAAITPQAADKVEQDANLAWLRRNGIRV